MNAYEFIAAFVRAFVKAEPMERQTIIAEWTTRLEGRDTYMRSEGEHAYRDRLKGVRFRPMTEEDEQRLTARGE